MLASAAGDSVIDIVDGGADSAATGEDDEDSALADDDESPLNALVVEPSDLWHAPVFGGAGFGLGGHGGHRGHGGGSNNSAGSDSSSAV